METKSDIPNDANVYGQRDIGRHTNIRWVDGKIEIATRRLITASVAVPVCIRIFSYPAHAQLDVHAPHWKLSPTDLLHHYSQLHRTACRYPR